LKRRFDPAEPEWMDRPQPVSEELMADLRNLRALNRFFGSYRLVPSFSCGAGSGLTIRCRVLDLATGSGDIPRLVAGFARRIGASVTIDAVDFQASTIEIARRLSQGFPRLNIIAQTFWSSASRARTISSFSRSRSITSRPKTRSSFCAALVNSPRGNVLVADLRRSWLAKLGIVLVTTLFFRERMTRNDARVSIERAFSFRELGELARAAGWTQYGHRRFRFARQAIWLERSHMAAVGQTEDDSTSLGEVPIPHS
jgi:SAM-dependent methyltransferase